MCGKSCCELRDYFLPHECLCQIKNPSARQTMSIELQADNSEVFAELKKILPKSLGRNVAAVIVSEFAAVLAQN